MNKAMFLLRVAGLMPEWMYGRNFLAKLAVGYMVINALAATKRMEA